MDRRSFILGTVANAALLPLGATEPLAAERTSKYIFKGLKKEKLESSVNKVEILLQNPNSRKSFQLGGNGTEPDGHSQLCREDQDHPWCVELKDESILEINTMQELRNFINTLGAINNYVNKNFRAILDTVLYNVSEKWDKSNYKFRGDCEEYAKTKYHFLTRTVDKAHRIPEASLRPTFVIQKDTNEGHLILMVTFKYKGTEISLILDNLTHEIETLNEASNRLYFYSSLDTKRKWRQLI